MIAIKQIQVNKKVKLFFLKPLTWLILIVHYHIICLFSSLSPDLLIYICEIFFPSDHYYRYFLKFRTFTFPQTLTSLDLVGEESSIQICFVSSLFFLFHRTNISSQTPSAKRSLGFLPQPAPLSVKKLRCNQDYTGWNKPRVPLSSHQQQQLQGQVNYFILLSFYKVIQQKYVLLGMCAC